MSTERAHFIEEPSEQASASLLRSQRIVSDSGDEWIDDTSRWITNTITSRGLPQTLNSNSAMPPVQTNALLSQRSRRSRSATPTIAVPVAHPGPELIPNLKPPLFSKGVAVIAGMVLGLVSGSLAERWFAGRTKPRQLAIVEVPLRPVAPTTTPVIARPAPPTSEPDLELARKTAEKTTASPDARKVARIVQVSALPATQATKVRPVRPAAKSAAVPKIALRLPAGSRPSQWAMVPLHQGTAASTMQRTSLAAHPGSAPAESPPQSRAREAVDPAGGRAPQRTILTRNPYETP